MAGPGPLRSVLDMEAPDVRPLTENLTSRTNKKKIFSLQPEKKPPGHLEQGGAFPDAVRRTPDGYKCRLKAAPALKHSPHRRRMAPRAGGGPVRPAGTDGKIILTKLFLKIIKAFYRIYKM